MAAIYSMAALLLSVCTALHPPEGGRRLYFIIPHGHCLCTGKSNKKRGLPAETGDPAETLPDAGKAAAPSGGGLICFGRADRLHRL